MGYVCNDSLEANQGEYRIYNHAGTLLHKGNFSVGSNQNEPIGDFSDLKDERYLILELQVNSNVYVNHFVNEERAHSFEKYKKFLSFYKEKLRIT